MNKNHHLYNTARENLRRTVYGKICVPLMNNVSQKIEINYRDIYEHGIYRRLYSYLVFELVNDQ